MDEEPPQWECTACGQGFQPTAWMVARSFRQCIECKRAKEREYRARRKASGNPIKAPNPPKEKSRARYHRHAADPAWLARRNEQARERYADPLRRAKVKARGETNRAIKAGLLERLPCSVCGHSPAEAHHDDYSKPLVVRWLCRTHHREHHRRVG